METEEDRVREIVLKAVRMSKKKNKDKRVH